jgi:hypothetical protein
VAVKPPAGKPFAAGLATMMVITLIGLVLAVLIPRLHGDRGWDGATLREIAERLGAPRSSTASPPSWPARGARHRFCPNERSRDAQPHRRRRVPEQRPVVVIEEEHPFQIRLRRLPRILVARSLRLESGRRGRVRSPARALFSLSARIW